MNLTYEDYDLLIQALDAWVSQDSVGTMLASVIGISMAPKDKADMAQQLANEKMDEADKENKSRNETATLLKAKLIMARDALLPDVAEEYLNE